MLFTVRRYLIFQTLILICSTILHALEDKVKIQYTGSSTIANFIRDAQLVYDQVEFELNTEPESSGGEQAILNNETDIAGVARDPIAEISEAGIQSALIGSDIVAVVLNEQNPISNLSKVQLKDIFTEIKPDRQPVSILHGELKPFTYKEFELLEGDIVYCTSDGYQDQFGGEKGKKFMAKRFKQLLMDIQHMKLCDQKAHLDETIERWKDPEGTGVNSYEQIDDICVMGIRV